MSNNQLVTIDLLMIVLGRGSLTTSLEKQKLTYGRNKVMPVASEPHQPEAFLSK